jgi:hypothetical protein
MSIRKVSYVGAFVKCIAKDQADAVLIQSVIGDADWDALFLASCETGSNIAVWVPNRPSAPVSIDIGSEEPIFSYTEITSEIIKTHLNNFPIDFSVELERLRFMYGSEFVHVRWGLVEYWL